MRAALRRAVVMVSGWPDFLRRHAYEVGDDFFRAGPRCAQRVGKRAFGESVLARKFDDRRAAFPDRGDDIRAMPALRGWRFLRGGCCHID